MFGNKYVPQFSEDYYTLSWNQRDFITCVNWLKYKKMTDNPDDYFKKKKSNTLI